MTSGLFVTVAVAVMLLAVTPAWTQEKTPPAKPADSTAGLAR